MTDVFLDKAEDAIMKLLREVRPTLLQSYGKVEHDLKNDNTVVTNLDKSIEKSLREVLHSLDSNIGIEGEEFGVEGSRDTYWLVDPIDGTEQFIRGLPHCKNLMALIDHGEVVWALMYMFVSDELWLARAGQGTTCNGKKITVPYRSISRSLIDLSVNLRDEKIVNTVTRLRSHINNFTIGIGLASIAGGKVDGSLCYGSSGGPWDYAPRALLFKEAGYRVANIGRDTYDFRDNDFLTAHPDNFDELMNLVTGKSS